MSTSIGYRTAELLAVLDDHAQERQAHARGNYDSEADQDYLSARRAG